MDPLQVAFRTAVESHVKRGSKERLIRKVVFKHLFTNMGLFRLMVLGLWLYQALGIQKLARALGIVKLLGMEQAEAFLPKVSRPFLLPKGEVYRAETAPPPAPPHPMERGAAGSRLSPQRTGRGGGGAPRTRSRSSLAASCPPRWPTSTVPRSACFSAPPAT